MLLASPLLFTAVAEKASTSCGVQRCEKRNKHTEKVAKAHKQQGTQQGDGGKGHTHAQVRQQGNKTQGIYNTKQEVH